MSLALTWTTLSNMCAKGRNEMLTSCVVGTTAVCGTRRLRSATRLTYALQIFPHQEFQNEMIITSKHLMTPAASETTFSWVNIAPFGFPEKDTNP